MHKSLDEFEIRPDPTTGFHGNRWCYNLKNGVATFSRLFLIIIIIIIILMSLFNEDNIFSTNTNLTYGPRWKTYRTEQFLMGSFSYLQVLMTYIRAWMSLKFGQIRPRTTELAALKRLKNLSFHFFSLCIVALR